MYCYLLLTCLLASAVAESSQLLTDRLKLLCIPIDGILFSGDVLCAMGKAFATHEEMKTANCTNCDKYFHCLSNSRVVNECANSTIARQVAKTVGDCLQKNDAGGADDASSQQAKLFGREGGDCAHEYLAAVSCTYNPDTKRCV